MKQKRSYILSLLALVLILCAFIQPAWAYFTASRQADGAVPIAFVRKTTITEVPDGLTKSVTIHNDEKSTVYVWVRARAYAGKQFTLTYDYGNHWEKIGDWVYYKTAIAPGTSTDPDDPLVVTLSNPGPIKPPDVVNVGVVYESITAFYDNETNDFRKPKAEDWSKALIQYTGPTTPGS